MSLKKQKRRRKRSSVRRPGGEATAAAAATCARVPPVARTLGVGPHLPTKPSSRIINAGCSGGSTQWLKVQRCPGDIVKGRRKKRETLGAQGRGSMWRTAKYAEPSVSRTW